MGPMVDKREEYRMRAQVAEGCLFNRDFKHVHERKKSRVKNT